MGWWTVVQTVVLTVAWLVVRKVQRSAVCLVPLMAEQSENLTVERLAGAMVALKDAMSVDASVVSMVEYLAAHLGLHSAEKKAVRRALHLADATVDQKALTLAARKAQWMVA